MSQVILTAYDNDGNSTVLDLFENEKIYYNFNFSDIQDFSALGNYSREFRIPASETNVAFFDAIHNVNLDGWFDFRKKVKATLSVDTIPIAEGYIQVKNVLRTLGNIYEYNIAFNGEVGNLAKSIGDKKLKDISDIADGSLDYPISYDSIPDPNAYVKLTLCDKWNFTNTLDGDGQQPLFNANKKLYVGHLTPAVNAYHLFDKIMQDAGFAWESDSLGDALNNVYVPFINSKALNNTIGLNDNASFLHTTSNITGLASTPQSPYNLAFYSYLTEVEDAGSNWSGGIFTAPFGSTYTFTINVPCSNNMPISASVYPIVMVQYYVNGSVLTTNVLQYGTNTFTINNSQSITMSAGDTFYVRIIFSSNYFGGTVTTTVLSGASLTLTNVESTLTNGDVLLRYNAPDMKQIDFIRSIQQMFNLIFVRSLSGQSIRVETMNSYLASGNLLDWTQKLDLAKDINLLPTTELQARNITFTYSSDGDVCNKFFTDNGRIYGNYIISEQDFDVTNDFANGEAKIELGFAPTPCNEVESTGIIVPKFIDASGAFVVPKPRILYYAGTANVPIWDEGTSSIVYTDVPLLSHYSVINADIDDSDLNFSPETPLHNIIGNPYDNLYNLYWRNYYHEIYDGQARIMEAFFALTLNDIYTTSFDDKIWIEDSWWRVLSIDGYGVGEYESTKVRLIRVLDIDNTCDATPITSNLDGSLNWSSGTGTEDCCKRYGYFWNPTTELCYSKPNNGTSSVGHGKPTINISELGGIIRVNGSLVKPVKIIADDGVLNPTDDNVIVKDLIRDVTVYLPTASIAKGQEYTIKNADSTYSVIVSAPTGETIDNITTKKLNVNNDAVTFVSDGTNWIIKNNIDNEVIWTMEFIDSLSVDIYAPYDMKILWKENVKNTPTISFLDDGSTSGYNYTILKGSLINMTANTAGVVNLHIKLL